MRVAVLGAGPSGLLAAWAVIDAGHDLTIFEKNPRKPDGTTAGVYYLHEACNLPLRKREVEVIVSGGKDWDERRRNYERKVYGTFNSTPVSMPKCYERQTAYDGMQALDFCWDIVHPCIVQESIIWDTKQQEAWPSPYTQIVDLMERYELVVNTIPLDVLFPMRKWRWERATIYRSEAPDDESYMLYNANPRVPWYRASAIFGAFTMEYPGTHQISGTNTPELKLDQRRGIYVYVKKVMDSPDAMPEVPSNVLLTGRYGAWKKQNLSHHAYLDTMQRLHQMQRTDVK